MATPNQKRLFIALAIVGIALALSYLAVGGIGENLVYYWSPSEIHEAGNKAVGASVRLGGLVVPGSIRYGDDLDLYFEVTDESQTVPVYAQTVPPAMFREGIGVVLEGTMRTDGTFTTQRLMVKHDNEYKAPEAGDDRDLKELMESMQFEAPST